MEIGLHGGVMRKYTLEAWTISGSRVADISALAKNRKFTMQRNEAETLSFDIDVDDFEKYCLLKLGGAHPRSLILPYASDIKLKVDGEYLFGTQVVNVNFGGDETTNTATVTCTGYLNLLNDRYVTATYTGVERTTIATNIIALTQAKPYGNLGITIGTQHTTGLLSDRAYQNDNVKLKLQQLAALSSAPFDMQITHDKEFRTFEKIGALRSDISLIYGGPASNVKTFGMEQSALRLYNAITGMGSGIGEVALTSEQSDIASMSNYYRREKIMQYNSVKEQQTLDDNTTAYRDLHREIIELPTAHITGNELPATLLSVGDRLPLRAVGHTWLDSVNGLYRIEKIDVTLDDNDFESDIALTFDDYGVDQNEQDE